MNYLRLGAVSPSGRLVYGNHGLDHTLIDLSSRVTFALHKGAVRGVVFLDDALLLEGTRAAIGVLRAPDWQRVGTIEFEAEHLARSKDGGVVAAVGGKTGFVWTRDELLAAAGVG